MKVYIAGKITGDPDYRAKFKRAEDVLREEGHTVINPAVLPSGLDRADYGRICAAMLDSADAVCFLPDFNQSQGASLEHEYSEYTGKEIMYIGGAYRDFNSQKTVTNADHIRAMNDEELACQLVIDVNGLEPCTLYLSAPTGKMYLVRTDAANKVKEWLQQPYKTED